MSKTITINIPVTIPDGWEFVEWRVAECDEWYIDDEGRPKCWMNLCESVRPYAIIRKIAPTPWKPVPGERVWWLASNREWTCEYYSTGLAEEYQAGFIYPESTTEAQREAITARVHALHMEIHAERDGVAR